MTRATDRMLRVSGEPRRVAIARGASDPLGFMDLVVVPVLEMLLWVESEDGHWHYQMVLN